jgi:hypothetical protein
MLAVSRVCTDGGTGIGVWRNMRSINFYLLFNIIATGIPASALGTNVAHDFYDMLGCEFMKTGT